MSEKPEHHHARRLADWINPTGARKVHSLVDKVYKMKNLELAWQKMLPKPGEPGKERPLGIPRIYDRVCQQALTNRLTPIFEPVFDDANFGYRKGRSAKDALRKVWKELKEGREWIVDADLKNFFGSVDHEKLLLLITQRIADGRVLKIIENILKAGCYAEGETLPTEQGTPQGGVVSPLLSNILLTPFDREMRKKGYRLTRYADDWVVTCTSRSEAQAALAAAKRILEKLRSHAPCREDTYRAYPAGV